MREKKREHLQVQKEKKEAPRRYYLVREENPTNTILQEKTGGNFHGALTKRGRKDEAMRFCGGWGLRERKIYTFARTKKSGSIRSSLLTEKRKKRDRLDPLVTRLWFAGKGKGNLYGFFKGGRGKKGTLLWKSTSKGGDQGHSFRVGRGGRRWLFILQHAGKQAHNPSLHWEEDEKLNGLNSY